MGLRSTRTPTRSLLYSQIDQQPKMRARKTDILDTMTFQMKESVLEVWNSSRPVEVKSSCPIRYRLSIKQLTCLRLKHSRVQPLNTETKFRKLEEVSIVQGRVKQRETIVTLGGVEVLTPAPSIVTIVVSVLLMARITTNIARIILETLWGTI